MTVEELIRPGDKVDITFIQQLENMNIDSEAQKVYKSKVLDLKENGNLDISMPSEGSKLILLPLGVRLEFVFYSKGGLYRALGQIKERYKSENVYMLEIELKTQLEKFQRREYFRYPCLLDFNYYTITEQEAKFESGDALLIHLRENDKSGENRAREYAGSIVDLSGGGIRFRTSKELEPNQWLLFEIHLQNENLNKQYYIMGSVISCIRTEKASDRLFEIRAKFQIKDASMREEIIRFIFEEERKSRQRGRW